MVLRAAHERLFTVSGIAEGYKERSCPQYH